MKTLACLAIGSAFIVWGILSYGLETMCSIPGHTFTAVAVALALISVVCAVPFFYEEVCEDKCVKRW